MSVDGGGATEEPAAPTPEAAESWPPDTGEKMLCFQCPAEWDVARIRGKSATGQVRPWQEVRLRTAQSSKPERRGWRSKRSKGPQLSEVEVAKRIAEGWSPVCPADHDMVDLPVTILGIIGYSGASKSHYMAAAVRELIVKQTLHTAGMDVSYMSGPCSDEMDSRMRKVYTEKKTLPLTDKGTIFGPVTYLLTSDATGDERVLVLFDVAGEDSVKKESAAAILPFLRRCAGIILVVDPMTIGDDVPEEKQTTRKVIDMVAELLRDMSSGRSPKDADQMLVLTMSKADMLRADVGWTSKNPAFPGVDEEGWSNADPTRVERILSESNDTAKRQWLKIGGGAFIAAATAKFGERNVRYAVVSALNEEPMGQDLTAPKAVACTVPIAHILHADHVL